MSPTPGCAGLEDAVTVLQEVLSVTRSLIESLDNDDLERAGSLLAEREQLLGKAAELRAAMRQPGQDAALEEGVKIRLVPLLNALVAENKKFIELLHQKRKLTIGRLQQIQGRKSIAAYTY